MHRKNERGGVWQTADDARMRPRRLSQQRSLDLYDDEANDANAAGAANAAIQFNTNRPPAPAAASLFHNSVQFRFREPRIMFQNRGIPGPGMLGRSAPVPHFGGPRFGGGGASHFPRPPRFQGHRPPPFFAAPPATRHLRPFMSPRSSSF